MDTSQVQAAVQALYTSFDGAERKRAETWLIAFRQDPGAWRLCLQLLLARPGRDAEASFAAATLRLACLKVQVMPCTGCVRISS